MGFSAKLFEIVLYPESYDISKLDEILTNVAVKDYAYILHDKDDKKSHVHVAIRTIDSRQSDYVAKWFNVNENAVGKVHGRWSDMLKYLTHANAPEKHQYDFEEVKSNFDWKKAIEKDDKNSRLSKIIEDISNGVIREYNYTDFITDTEYIMWNRQIENAWKYRRDKIKGVNRLMEAIFITGDAGVGKTTYAKQIAENKGYSIFVSSGSNDLMDDYKGQDCIILDDLRPSCIGLSDLLKMLDNNTASTVKSRYKNKVLECKLMIITTTLTIDKFFDNVFKEEKETSIQLKRRCKTHIRMEREKIYASMWLDNKRCYSKEFPSVNPIQFVTNSKDMTEEEMLGKLSEMLGDYKVMVDDIKSNIDDYKQVNMDEAKEVEKLFDNENK